MALVHAATAHRPEEASGLKWPDIDWRNGQIKIGRDWSKGKETQGKNEESMAEVVMHPVLTQALQAWRRETLYHRDSDWVFALTRSKGKTPRSSVSTRFCQDGSGFPRRGSFVRGFRLAGHAEITRTRPVISLLSIMGSKWGWRPRSAIQEMRLHWADGWGRELLGLFCTGLAG